MQRKGLQILLSLLLCFLLCGCCLSHDWQDATCTEPRTCAKCGQTEGIALGHSWKEATCSDAKTCIRCGTIEGSPLGHVWEPATHTAPKTCARCGLTDGDPLKTLYFDLSPREYVERFNSLFSSGYEWMFFREEGSRVNLYYDGEQMNIFLQFLDNTQHSTTYVSGLDRENWNKLNFYIATDDRSLDAEYFAAFSYWLVFLGTPLELEFDPQDYINNVENIGNDRFPEFVYTQNGICYTMRFYDDSAGFGEPTTVYAVSIELVQP